MPTAKPIKILPPAKHLCECFIYDQTTDDLYWRVRPRKHFTCERDWLWWNNRFSGTMAGFYDGRYTKVTINRRFYKAHRIIWKMMTGKEPPSELDHKDGNYLGNRWNNLRPATHTQQKYNSHLYRNNTSGSRGVYLSKSGRKWIARIRVHGILRYLGSFDTFDEAVAAYEKAARELHGAFYRHQIV